MSDDFQVRGVSADFLKKAQMQAQKAASLSARIAETKAESFEERSEQGFFSIPTNRFKTLEERDKHRIKETEKGKDPENPKKVEAKQNAKDTAGNFQQKNPELQQKTLLILLSRFTQEDTAETILQKVLETYSDYYLADEALSFLLETSGGKLKEQVQIAKDALNADYGRQIRAGKNTLEEVRSFSKELGGSPTSLRAMYADVTGSPRDPFQLFDELFSKFTYEKMKEVIDFFLHSLGSDLKAKGPSISRGELHKLVDDTRIMQAILGIFRFFASRMSMVQKQFTKEHLLYPSTITFETLAKSMLQLLQERYPSTDKIYLLGKFLGISEELAAQVIIYSQYRDALRQIAPRLYRNTKHKEELKKSLLDTLEELEEELLEDEEEEDEQDG